MHLLVVFVSMSMQYATLCPQQLLPAPAFAISAGGLQQELWHALASGVHIHVHAFVLHCFVNSGVS